VIAMFEKGGGSFTHMIKASEPVVSVLLGLLVNRIIPVNDCYCIRYDNYSRPHTCTCCAQKPLTALSLLPVTYGVAYASTLGNLNVASMSREFSTKAAK